MAKQENKAERIKREKDGLDVWTDIERYAQTGFQTIDSDDLDRFKWYGLYTQRRSSEDGDEGFFMLRVKVPNGIINSEQLETIGWLSRVYARSTGDITTRQGIQIHYVRVQDVPHIIAELNQVGLTTVEACGDVVRNVVGCPLAGIDEGELFDASPLVDRVKEKFLTDSAFSNLPRKFKISITGCRHQCAQHQINDIGLVATKNAEGELGFDLWVGGGLGARPHLAKNLGVFLYQDEALDVITRIVEIFRDLGYREDRRKARLKFLVADWGAQRFREELETRLGRKLTEQAPRSEVSHVESNEAMRDHVGIAPERTAGHCSIGVAVVRGRISGRQMTTVAGLARRYASGNIRLTNSQNLIVLDVPKHHVEVVSRELAALDLPVEASGFRRGTVACTGHQFCKLAIVETKSRAEEIIYYLERQIPDFRDDIRISVTGCVNSCAQYQIAEIGLVGVKGQENGEEVDYFQIHLGGRLGRDAAFGRKLSKRVRVEEAKFYIEALINSYRARRRAGERFYQFVARQDAAALEKIDEALRMEVSSV